MFASTTGKGFGEILASLERFVAELEPGDYTPSDLAEVLRRVSRAEKLCGTAKLLLTKRAPAVQIEERDGKSSTTKWLSEQSGESVGRTRRDMETAQKLDEQPDLEQALRDGSISPTQAALILPAIEADPDASKDLINAAQEDAFNVLRERVASVIAAKRSEEEASRREARLRERRFLHIITTDEGAVSIRGELAPVEGGIVKNALREAAREIFAEARREGRREAHHAYMADALVRLCQSSSASGTMTGAPCTPSAPNSPPGGAGASSGGDSGNSPFTPGVANAGRAASSTSCSGTSSSSHSPGTPRAEIVLHVSAEALRRGGLESGEICEIQGVGPVSLSTVEYLLGNAWAKLLIEKGRDIASVTHFGRWIPAHLESALSNRDRVCAVPGCGIDYGLERDHIIPVEEGGPTELANLVKLCRRHHYLKTHRFWRLTGSPGSWNWVNIRPDQDAVAADDPGDVALPGEPTAGLARPMWRSSGLFDEDAPSDAPSSPEHLAASEADAPVDQEAADRESFVRQTLGRSSVALASPRATMRLGPGTGFGVQLQVQAEADVDDDAEGAPSRWATSCSRSSGCTTASRRWPAPKGP